MAQKYAICLDVDLTAQFRFPAHHVPLADDPLMHVYGARLGPGTAAATASHVPREEFQFQCRTMPALVN